jgi:hypothetical protein
MLSRDVSPQDYSSPRRELQAPAYPDVEQQFTSTVRKRALVVD